MSSASQFFSGSGLPIGSIVEGNRITDSKWLLLDNTVYNKSDYPLLDISKMLTFDGQSIVTGPTIAARSYLVNHVTGTTWYAVSTTDNLVAKSTDNGSTWTTGSLPGVGFYGSSGNYWNVSYTNGLYFFYHSGANYTTSYYTSTDGLSWTARTLPTWGTSSSIGSVGYINGRYVIAPSITASIQLFGLYSTDGITWIQSSILHSGAASVQTNLYAGSGIWTLPYSKNTGISCHLMYSGGVYSNGGPAFWTTDGINWIPRYHQQAGSQSAYYVSPSAASREDAFGNLADSNQVFSSLAANVPFSSYKGVQGYPLAKSNITAANGNYVSEDHGISLHRTDLTNGGAFGFSGTRLLSINTSGNVSWTDISSTKFRATKIPDVNTGNFRTSDKYIKAR